MIPSRCPLPALAFALLTVVPASAGPVDLSVDAPASLAETGSRVRGVDLDALAQALHASGLEMPARIAITLVPDTDPRAASVPSWVVGLARGTSDIVIFPDRIGPYPYDSLESVVRHEIVHLALAARAGDRPLPRWFHEGVAVTLESGWSTRDEVRLLAAALASPDIADINRLFSSEAHLDNTQAYRLSAALVDDIRERYARDAPGAIAAGVAAGASFEAAFYAATGERVEAAADRAWGRYRRLSRWLLAATSPSAVWTLILALAVVGFVARLRRRREQRRRWDDEDDDDGEHGHEGLEGEGEAGRARRSEDDETR